MRIEELDVAKYLGHRLVEELVVIDGGGRNARAQPAGGLCPPPPGLRESVGGLRTPELKEVTRAVDRFQM